MAPTTSYATVAQVQTLLDAYGVTIGESSTPTTTEVEHFIDQAAATVDGVLKGRGYSVVPVTGTTDLYMVGAAVAQRAAAMAFVAGFGADALPATIQMFLGDWSAFIAALRDGSQRLVDQTPLARFGTMRASRWIGD